MARTQQSFPEAMLNLQETLAETGYTVSRVQRVDIGLTSSGFQTDMYRVVFYGRAEEIRRVTSEHPELIPYLPLKIAVFAEGEETLLVASSPMQWGNAAAPQLQKTLADWTTDLQKIFHIMRDY